MSKRLKELITCKDDVLSKPDVGLAAGCMFLVSLYLKDGGCKASIITNSTWKDFKCFYERTVIVCVCLLWNAMMGSSSLVNKAPPWSSLMMPGPEALRQVAHQGITLWVALPTPSQCWHVSVGLRWCRAPEPSPPCWTDWWEAYLAPGVEHGPWKVTLPTKKRSSFATIIVRGPC